MLYCCNGVDPFEFLESAPPMDYDSSDLVTIVAKLHGYRIQITNGVGGKYYSILRHKNSI